MLRVRVCGGVEVETDGHVLPDALLSGRQGRLVLAYLVCERQRAVRREELAELLWPERLPESWPASISAVVSRLRRLFSEAGLDGTAVLASSAGSYQLQLPEGSSVDIEVLAAAAADAEEAALAGDLARTHESAAAAEQIAARGFLLDDCEWVDRQRDVVRDHRVRAALALSTVDLAAGAAGRAVEAAREALALDPSREEAYRQLMRALAANGERGEALRVWERCRIALVEELGIDPSPETEGVYLDILGAAPTETPVTTALPSGVVTFLLTDIVESSGLWEHHPTAMAVALERHDAIVGEIVAAHGGTLLKSKLEGDATVSVFARATGGAAAALALLDALAAEPWPEGAAPRLRMAMHTGEAFERNGDYFGPALNRAARLRSLAGAGQVLLSQAVAELVRDHLPPDVVLFDRGHRDLRGLSRGENVYELARAGGDVEPTAEVDAASALVPPSLPPVLAGATPFVGRGDELDLLTRLWERVVDGEPRAVVIGGEPGVGKSRLAGELAARAHASGAIVLYGRCDEDLAAPLQPFIEPVRVLAPTLGPTRLRAVRGVDELRRVVPELAELLSDDAPMMRADPDTERLALFDAVTHLVRTASVEAPVLLVLDDLHWAGKTTLSLLRHLLLGAKDARLLVVGTYRDTELGRTHPLAATLADLRRDGATDRVVLGGLGAADIAAYLAAIGNTDRALGRELAEVTSGNPFFLIEVLRHVEETGGAWEPGSLPEGVRDATGRRLSRLSDATNEALSVAAVVGTSFDLELVEQVRGIELVDEIAEACQAGLVAEEVGTPNHFRFAHALVRQVLLTELVTLKRVRLHRAIAELLEASAPAADPDARLADLAYHWFECATTGGAAKAVEACRHAGDRAMERVAYEEAGDLYGMALQALDVVEDADGEARAALHLARCDALLTAGDVAGARGAIDSLERAAHGSERLTAWYATYAGQLAVLAEPDRLTEIVQSIGAAAGAMRAAGDLTGEAKAHYVHASALERLGQIGAAERALDAALAAARGAGDRQLQDAILAEAPPAALWGPSPVTRASGRCLDVVRVLRITAGAPAVESVALRCQAVLEALRGRMDAARRMIGSARRTVEQLGLAHRRLETEVAAGFIELLDGEAAQAEVHLRAAYDELRERGLGGEAAQAAAFLGRALLLQDRVDEADQVATEAEALAGSDLKAAIAWRDVRAEAAARRGDTATALELAREAVDLATATDALLLVADARLTLAAVLRATGDIEAAEAEAQRAVEACEAKGATVLAARARAAMRSRVPAPATATVEPPAPPASDAPVANLAMATTLRFQEAFNRGDWDGVRATQSPSLRFEDRRQVLALVLEAPEAADHYRVVYDVGARFDRAEDVATRGENVALARWSIRAPGADWTFLAVTRVDSDGRTTDYVMFDIDNLDGATALLDELEGKPPTEPSANKAWRAALSMKVASDNRDWQQLLDTLTPTFENHDLRSGVHLHLLGDDALGPWRTMFTLDDWSLDRKLIATRGENLALMADCVSFVDRDAGPAEVANLCIVETSADGRVALHTSFDLDALEVALEALDARFAQERLAYPSVTDRFANAAWRASRRLTAAENARDWDALVALFSPHYERHDRRTGVVLDQQGADALSVYRVLFDLDEYHVDVHLVATRGDSLAIVEHLATFRDGAAGPAEVASLTVVQIDSDERIAQHVSFDADAFTDAFDELDARYVACGGADVRSYCHAFDARHWDALRSLIAPECAVHDHRPAGLGSITRDGFVDYMRSMAELSPDARLWTDHAVTEGNAVIILARASGSRDGGPWELAHVSVALLDAAGATAIDNYELADIDAAWARFNELAARSTEGPFANAAWRACRRLTAAENARDWEAISATFSPHYERHDRRIGVVLDQHGADALSVYRVAFDLDEYHVDRQIVATRGESLVLTKTLSTFRDGAAGWSEVEVLAVLQVDADERIVYHVGFEANAFDDALDELDARYVALGGPDFRQARHAFDARDWEAFAALFAPGCAMTDTRTAGWGSISRDEFVEYMQAAVELAPDARLWTDHAINKGAVGMVASRLFGTREGGLWELAFLSVAESDGNGLTLSADSYELADIDVARARFNELVARSTEEPFANAAWRACQRLTAAENARDWDAVVANFSPHYEHRARRTGVNLDLQGADALSVFGVAFDLDEYRVDRQLVATRGESLALTQDLCTFRDGVAGPAEVEVLTVVEVDADGQIVRHVFFDSNSLEEAFDELDARYVAFGGEDLRVGSGAFGARDWHRFAALFEAGCVAVDHRPAGWGWLDRDHLIAYERGIDALAPDARTWILHARSRGEVAIMVGSTAGTYDGGRWEVPMVYVTRRRTESRIASIDLYALDDIDAAWARFNELVARSTDEPFANAAWWAMVAVERACDARDWDALTSAISPEYVDHDRRGLALVISGDDALATYRTMFSLDEYQLHYTLLATRGDRLALGSILVRFRDGASGPAEVACLQVVEVDADGRVLHGVALDADDLDGAFDELDARYVALGGIDRAAIRHAFRARDRDAFASFFEPGYVVTDHRLTGWGRLEFDGFLDYQRQSVALAPDAELWIDHVVASEGVELTVAGSRGTRDGGGPWVLPTLAVATRSERGRIATSDIFEPDDIARARARFDEVVALRRAPRPNRASIVLAAQDEAFARRDREAYRAAYRQGGRTVDDRRAIVGGAFSEAESLASLDYLFNLPSVAWTRRLVATRGDLLALVEDRIEASDGEVLVAELSCLTLAELDSGGYIVRHTVFDVDDLEAAMAELDARLSALTRDPLALTPNLAARAAAADPLTHTLVATLGDRLCAHRAADAVTIHAVDADGEITAVVTFDPDDRGGVSDELTRRYVELYGLPARGLAMGPAINAHDLPGVRAGMSDDCTFEDHRHLRIVEYQGPDGYVALLRSSIELAPDLVMEMVRVDAVEPWGHVILSRMVGNMTVGGAFDNPWIAVVAWGDAGLITNVVLYEPGDVAAALARLAELAPRTEGP